MRTPFLWAVLGLCLAVHPALAKDVSSHERVPLLEGLQLFEDQFRSAEQEGLMTHSKDLSVRARLDLLLARYDLIRSPDGAALNDGQWASLRVDLNDLSGMLFHR